MPNHHYKLLLIDIDGTLIDQVKAVADYITLDVAQSGLAAAINKFLLPAG